MIPISSPDIVAHAQALLSVMIFAATTQRLAPLLKRFRRRNGQDATEAHKKLAQAARQLAELDCAGLRQAILDLSHGKLSTQLAIRSLPLDPARFREAGEIAEALNTIISVLHQTAADFNTLTELPCRRLCYVGPDSYLEGTTCAEMMGKILNGRGVVAVITSPGSMALEMRVAGFQARLRESFPGVELSRIIQCTGSADTLLEAVQHETKILLDTIPQLAGIYLTRGGVPAAAARSVEAEGKAGRVRIISHDMLDETMQYLQKGVITATLGQDPYGQGHDPVIHLFNHLAAGWQPPSPRMLTQLDIVTPETCDRFWKAGQGALLANADRYATPARARAARPLRLAIVGRADNSFFDLIRRGILDAAEKILPLNALVELIVPEENRRLGKISADVYGPVVESVVAQRYDGLAIGIFDPKLVPAVNRAAQAGIPVVTYNSEPGGLRSMIHASIEQSEKLLNLGRAMAEAVGQINTATQQVNSSMCEVSSGTVSQTEQINRTRSSLDSLLNHIAEVDRQAGAGATAAESTAGAALAGAQAIEKTLGSMQQIQASVAETSGNVDNLGRNSAKIGGIMKAIGSIAYQIKLLGINAAVEAAHAGTYGAGFSIVANEIRSLADRTAKASADIVDVVKTVQSSIQQLEQAMVASLQSVRSGSDLAGQAGSALDEIRTSVEQNKGRLGDVAKSASQMQTFSHEVGHLMEVVASVSEKNAAAAEEVSAATQEMTARLEDVRQMAQNLAQIAEGEQNLLAKFNSPHDA